MKEGGGGDLKGTQSLEEHEETLWAKEVLGEDSSDKLRNWIKIWS